MVKVCRYSNEQSNANRKKIYKKFVYNIMDVYTIFLYSLFSVEVFLDLLLIYFIIRILLEINYLRVAL